MKPDLYTKRILTMASIALCILSIKALFDSLPLAHANQSEWNCFEYKTISAGDAKLIANILNQKNASTGFSGSAGGLGFTCYR